jgi:hypothetical protein
MRNADTPDDEVEPRAAETTVSGQAYEPPAVTEVLIEDVPLATAPGVITPTS